MQFRRSLLHVIKTTSMPKLQGQVHDAETQATGLRRTLSGFFVRDSEEPAQSVSNQNSASIRQAANNRIDLSQLQNVVSGGPYWDSHEELMRVAKFLPSLWFAIAAYWLPLIAIWTMTYCFLRGGLTQPANTFPLLQHALLLLPEGAATGTNYHQLIIALATWSVMMLSIFVIFHRIRRRVRTAHATISSALRR